MLHYFIMYDKQKITVAELSELDGDHFVHLNIRSIRDKKKIDEMKLRFTGTNFKFISITESWLIENDCDSTYDIGGYHMYRVDRTWRDDPLSTFLRLEVVSVLMLIIISVAIAMN